MSDNSVPSQRVLSQCLHPQVVLDVEHPAEVRSELEVMRTDVGESLELVCSVHSNPVSEVLF